MYGNPNVYYFVVSLSAGKDLDSVPTVPQALMKTYGEAEGARLLKAAQDLALVRPAGPLLERVEAADDEHRAGAEDDRLMNETITRAVVSRESTVLAHRADLSSQ